MARYEITGPDGAKYEVTAPDDATEAQVLEYAKQNFNASPAPKDAPAPLSLVDRIKQAAMPEMGIFRGARDAVDAGAQMLVRGAAAAGIAPESEVARVDKMNRDAEQQYQKGRADTGFDALRLVGQVMGTAPMFAAAPVGGTLAAKTAIGAATGAGFGALNPVENPGEDFWSQKVNQAKTGAISGAIAAPVTAALSRIIQPKTSDEVTKLMREGVTPTPGQVLGGSAKAAEEKLTSVPIVGDAIRMGQRRAQGELNTAAVNRALSPIGEKLPKGVVGRDAIDFAEKTLGQSYDDVLNRVGAPKIDNQMLGELANLRNIVANQPKDFAGRLEKIVDNEILGRTQDGRLTGEAIKAAEGNLGQLARGLRSSPDFDTRKLGEAVDETQRILRSWLERSAPKDVSQQLKATNAGWANFKRVQRAASSVAAEDGVFSAAQLHNAVRALDRTKDKAGFARGDALMQDLSGAAKKALSQTVPDSGTPGRLMAAALAGGGLGYLSPTALALTGAAALPYTPAGQKTVAALLARRPELAQPVAEAVRTVGAPVLTSGLFGLLSR